MQSVLIRKDDREEIIEELDVVVIDSQSKLREYFYLNIMKRQATFGEFFFNKEAAIEACYARARKYPKYHISSEAKHFADAIAEIAIAHIETLCDNAREANLG